VTDPAWLCTYFGEAQAKQRRKTSRTRLPRELEAFGYLHHCMREQTNAG
jgi:hypothetical protein